MGTDYRNAHKNYDEHSNLYALTWPEHRGLTCPPGRYRRLIDERLAAIAAHGDPSR